MHLAGLADFAAVMGDQEIRGFGRRADAGAHSVYAGARDALRQFAPKPEQIDNAVVSK
jgi:hypothetical protein